jgi:GntP family gluconate:H+ symporter
VSLFAAFPSVPLTPTLFSIYAIPISLILLIGTILFMRHQYGTGETISEPSNHTPTKFHSKAWYSFLIMLLILIAGLFIFHLTPSSLIQVVMFSGMVAVLLLAPAQVRGEAFPKGTKHAGMIIFDLCGAGALGSVISASSLTPQAFSLISTIVPVVLVPFILAAIIQTAQGSRVVTVVVTGEILAGSTIVNQVGSIPLFLMISGGACILSYMTDPYFWLVQRATGDDIPTVVRNYTIPLAGFGIILLAASFVLALLNI